MHFGGAKALFSNIYLQGIDPIGEESKKVQRFSLGRQSLPRAPYRYVPDSPSARALSSLSLSFSSPFMDKGHSVALRSNLIAKYSRAVHIDYELSITLECIVY